MFFNHHHLCDNLNIDLKGPCIPQSKKDWKDTWNHIKRYFSIERVKEAEDVFEVIFDISYNDFKEDVIRYFKDTYTVTEEEVKEQYSYIKALKYLLNKFRDWIVDWYNIYRNRWRNGFYDGETFSLDYTSAVYLYERVKRYREKAKGFIRIGWDDFSEEEISKGDKPHTYIVPVLKLRDIDKCKDRFNRWYNLREDKYTPGWCCTVVWKELSLDECILLILEYLERFLKSENGQYLFEENNKEVYDWDIDDINEQFKKADKEHPDHMFWYVLEEHWGNRNLSYAFQIYGIIINSMWW